MLLSRILESISAQRNNDCKNQRLFCQQ